VCFAKGLCSHNTIETPASRDLGQENPRSEADLLLTDLNNFLKQDETKGKKNGGNRLWREVVGDRKIGDRRKMCEKGYGGEGNN